ncbi:hypothetical protein EGT36_29315 [Agrobacterium sp. FDAARGOS_525]|uniref:hypothetical protein n=1 Tax=Brucella rhizosphaerae TaxID=571254 RepID=UPI000463E9AB|nr:hypothetical protein [Brucella rhizosphaerae]RSC21543.1 hypothetical protein EGT36_29315 [Agrobacterium sp. FDAARGOS_525]
MILKTARDHHSSGNANLQLRCKLPIAADAVVAHRDARFASDGNGKMALFLTVTGPWLDMALMAFVVGTVGSI